MTVGNATSYQTVTARIVAMLESGVRPWVQGWQPSGGGAFVRPLRVDGTPYRGVNVVNLWAAATARGFTSPHWMTFKAARDHGAGVRKGAKAELAFYVGTISRTEEREGESVDVTIPFLKAYPVFNADEVDGLPAHYYAKPVIAPCEPGARHERAEAFMAGTGADIGLSERGAYYRPSADSIRLPAFERYAESASYYGDALHELTHWTGAKHRLDRHFDGTRWGDPAYAFEELIAELGAAYLCADLEVENEPREDHASYIAGWIKHLRDDDRAIFRAAAHAERAAGYLHGLQPQADAALAA